MVLAARRNNPVSLYHAGRAALDRVLYRAELELIHPETRHTRVSLEKLLHPLYTETGSTGNTYGRATIIEMMIGQEPGGVVIRDFQAHPLNADTAFVTYRSIGTGGQEARRTSIWTRTDARWQLRYHQGTRIPNTWGTIS